MLSRQILYCGEQLRHLQGSDNQITTNDDNGMTGLLKVGAFAMFLATVIELIVA